jgi:FkbM family methyltransferase
VLGTLPPAERDRLAVQLEAAEPMDYERARILLRRSSERIEMRLRSAAKEPWTVAWIETFQPGDVFYDVGANVGAYSLIAAASSGSRVRTIAFEPSAPSYHDLCVNIALNGFDEAITPLPFALWSESSMIEFAHCSLEPGSSKHTFDFSERRGNREVLYRQRMPALALDDAVSLLGLPGPTHMKIDTEGSELQVLEGARATLAAPSWRSVLAEQDDEEAGPAYARLLEPFGFRLEETHRRKKTGGTAYALYVRST